MGRRSDKKSHKYWLSAKPLSRKKKFRELRAKKLLNKIKDEPADMCSTDNQIAPTNLNSIDFPTTQFATGNQDATEATVVVKYQQEKISDIEQTALAFAHEIQIQSQTIKTDTDPDPEEKTSDVPEDRKELPATVISDESLLDLSFVRVPEAKIEKFELPRTRQIVDFEYIFTELHRKFINHNPVRRCTLDTVQLVSTLRLGLKTRFVFKCGMCSKEEHVMSEPDESGNLSVNESAVAGAVSIGIEYEQAREMFNAINVPYMSQETHEQYHDKIAALGWIDKQ